MDQKIELPNELFEVIQSVGNNPKLGLFAQTSSYMQSLSWQTKFIYYQKTNDQAAVSHTLIELYLNYSLLLKESAQSLHKSWCIHLREFRKNNTDSVTNSLLATALLVLMDKTDESRLRNEFSYLIGLENRLRPQLVNSILYIMGQAEEKDEEELKVYLKNHSIAYLLKESAAQVSIMETKLILMPFIKNHSVKKYFPVVFKEMAKILNPQMLNFFNIIIALLKLLPEDDAFWQTPFETVPNLLIYLHEKNHHSHILKLAEVFETIQNRLDNKEFLIQYHTRLTKMLDADQPLPQAISLARMNANIAIQSEDWIFENKAIFLHGDRDSISYLGHHLKKLKSDDHIKMIIEESLEIQMRSNATPVIDNVFILTSEIRSPDFLMETIKKLYKKLSKSHVYETRLTAISKHSLLDEARGAQLFKEIRLYITENENIRNEQISHDIHAMLPVLCSRIQSQPVIQELIDLITDQTELDKLSEWLKDNHALIDLKCLFILLPNMLNDESLAYHLKQLLAFIPIREYKFKVTAILDIITDCLSKISSRDIVCELIILLLQVDESLLIKHISTLALQAPNAELVKKCIQKFQNCHEFLLRRDEYTQWCEDALSLLFKLPLDSSWELLKPKQKIDMETSQNNDVEGDAPEYGSLMP